MAQLIGDPLFPVIADDLLVGSVGNDYIYGAGGNDTLIGGDGVDIFDGGAGTSDVISFADAMAAVAINLFAVDPGNTVNTVFSFDEVNAPALFGFEGVSSATIVLDPAGGGNKVAKVIKAADAGASAGTTIGYSYGGQPSDLGLTNPIDFTAASTTMTLRVWIESPQAGIKVRLKVEDQSDIGATTEADAFTTDAIGWQTLTFDFANAATNNGNATRLLNLADTHDKITVFFNFGVSGENGGDGTFYFDDLKFIETPGPQGTISNDGYGNVETVQNVENVIGSAFGDSITGGVGANGLDGGAGNDTIDGGAGADRVAGGLGNDLLIGGDGLDKIDGGDGFDTVSFIGAENGVDMTIRSGPSTTELVTFQEATAPTFIEFGPDNDDEFPVDGGGTTTRPNAVIVSIANDPTGGTNRVGKFEKNEGALSFAGTVVGTGSNSTVEVLPFTDDDHTMTMRVWSAVAGTEVLLKLESTTTGGASVGAFATTTVASGWQTLTFDFGPALAGPGTGALDLNIEYNKVVLFFNFGEIGTPAGEVFYFDDIRFFGTAVSSIEDDGFGNTEGLTGVENAIGSSFADRLTGDGLNNSLAGAAGADTLTGGAGNDSLDGGTGNDSLVGGTGNDSYTVDSATDKAVEATGGGTNDIVTSSATYTLGVEVEKLTLSGSSAINGTGNTLANTLTGNTGANALVGGSGNDTLSGGAGNDSLDGGLGNDSLVGSTGNDSYTVDSSTDLISETTTTVTEIDSVTSSVAWTLGSYLEKLTLTGSTALNGTGNTLANTLTGNTGANLLVGGSGNDTLSAGAGNDSLDGGLGNDSLVGSTGNDSYTVDSSTDLVSETTTTVTEIDSVTASASYTLGSNLETLTLTGSTAINGTGNTQANTLTGNTGANALVGGSGNDTLSAGAGNDSLDGGLGNDSLVGSTGNDSYTVDSATDVISETTTLATEIDSVTASVAWTLGANLEKLTLTGSSALAATGNTLANTITGNSGANLLNGGAGNDTLSGGLGNDSYTVDSATDVISEATTTVTEIDSVTASVAWTLGANLEKLTLTGSSALAGTGNTLANTITGNSGANLLNGGAGNDTLIGGLGNDSYTVDSSTDLISETTTTVTEIDSVTASASFTLGSNLEKLTLTGSTAINGTGNTQANTLTGNTGANALVGGSGNDTLSAGAGNDSLDGGLGNDSLVGSTGNDSYTVDIGTDVISETTTTVTEIDSVTSSVAWTLGANLENLTLTGSSALAGTGNTLANTITGNSGANLLNGGTGNDSLSGGAGNDGLDGGTGNDLLMGGAGNDSYTVDSSADRITETTTATEIDSVSSSVSFVLGSYLEKLTLSGTSALAGTGNTLANTLTGNTGSNVLAGRGGNDTLNGGDGNDSLDGGTGNDSMNGGTGNDSYTVDSSTDLVSETSTLATEIDHVTSSATFTLGSNLEFLSLTGTAAVNATGNTLANTISGNTGNNLLSGLAGNDVLTGGEGIDSFRFASAINGTTNIDVITDFINGEDRIELEGSVFTKFTTTGVLNAANFVASESGVAVDSSDYVLYETDTGKLFYDADGNGSGVSVLIATLSGAPALASTDIFLT